MKHFKLITWLCLTTIFTSCLQIGGDTIVLPEAEANNELQSTIDENKIPISIQEELEVYMPIYEGSQPPIIEGSYLISPFETVYCTDEYYGGYSPGSLVNDEKIRFTNQNSNDNSLSFYEKSVSGDSYGSGNNGFIIGRNNDFTAYFIVEGTYNEIYNKKALVISGTILNNGIEDLLYAFIMLDKGYDPDGIIMNVDEFRVFKDSDEFTGYTDWDKSAPLEQVVINQLLLSNN